MPVRSDIQIITAPSILGLKPTGVEQLAETLLSNGLLKKISTFAPIIEIPALNQFYSNERDIDTGILNTTNLKAFSLTLSTAIHETTHSDRFVLVLGGDCSVLIGIMLGLKMRGEYGLFFVDAHADFYGPEKSITGEAADMDLALVTGRGPQMLTNIHDAGPYVKDKHVVHLGQRDMQEAKTYNAMDIRRTGIYCVDASYICEHGISRTMHLVKKKVDGFRLDGYWLHFDTDVISDDENPAVDYRLPGGLSFQHCEELLTSLITQYKVIGMSVTIFNPSLDTDGRIGNRLTDLLATVLRNVIPIN